MAQTKENDDKFCDILLDMSNTNDLLAAWEKECQNTIKDFEVTEGKRLVAEKVDWLEELPEVLTFQLNRLSFKDGQAVKQFHKVPIPKQIYPDRFHYQNREEVTKLRKKIQEFRDQIEVLEGCLKKYQKFNNSEFDLVSSLQNSLDFFQKQGSETIPQISSGKAHLPLNQQPPIPPASASPVIKLL